jgi:hypothetical protein
MDFVRSYSLLEMNLGPVEHFFPTFCPDLC